MDHQQETTEQIHKKARIKSQESVVRSSFPLDLISEILSKLPAKSVGRFRCVSKLWSSVTTDPYFINKFETQSRQRKPCLLVSFKRDDRLFVFSIPQDRQSSNEYHPIASQPVHSYHMTYPKSRRFFPRTDKTERFGFIMSFDVRSEEFHVIKLPCNNSGPGGILASYEGRLACVTGNAADDGTILWTLMDAEKHEWSRRYFPIPIPYYDRSVETVFNFIGITDAGEFVYVPNRFRKLYYVLYYDPKRNKFHRVEFKGIADDESRLKHGLVNSRLYNIPAVMNHIESLRSF
ncbi:hypothetical protein Bca4012_098033 [Brassica carinata]